MRTNQAQKSFARASGYYFQQAARWHAKSLREGRGFHLPLSHLSKPLSTPHGHASGVEFITSWPYHSLIPRVGCCSSSSLGEPGGVSPMARKKTAPDQFGLGLFQFVDIHRVTYLIGQSVF